MLIGREKGSAPQVSFSKQLIVKGPLGQFLQAVTSGRGSDGGASDILHIVNVRDWHVPSRSYDLERVKYGAHCEANTWGADYIEGLEKYLDPAREVLGASTAPGKKGQFTEKDGVRFYQVFSDSIFDFRPHYSHGNVGEYQEKHSRIELEDLMDVLIYGSNNQLEELAGGKYCGQELKELAETAKRESAGTMKKKPGDRPDDTRVYVAVIGVYTDIKIQILLMGLKSRYDIPSLAVSDTLTISPSIERHLGALDFADKLLNVEVIHGLKDLVRFLGGDAEIKNEPETVAAERFSDYARYFQDKQNVLAHRDARLNEYVALTQKRSENVYTTVSWANKVLLIGGTILLGVTIIGAVWSFVQPDYVDWKLPAVTGGLSLSQLAAVFFGQPMVRLQRNLTNLANFRMILESHSLKMALARFHLTTAETLRGNLAESEGTAAAAETQVQSLKNYITVIEQIEEADYKALSQLGLGDREAIERVLEEKGQQVTRS
ncbi:MAG: hypothetical protein E3J30_11920 [Anaerolineales bacterium]|nr:MAG: hypothetical protein E3J30_11920 [Anaerolineales bacterium]